jgi:hypothetical protein
MSAGPWVRTHRLQCSLQGTRRDDLNNASTKCPQDLGSGHIVFNVLLKETKTDDTKNASTKCPPDAGSGHIVLVFSKRKQGQMIQNMLQRNVRRALGPDISFSMFSSRNKER